MFYMLTWEASKLKFFILLFQVKLERKKKKKGEKNIRKFGLVIAERCNNVLKMLSNVAALAYTK